MYREKYGTTNSANEQILLIALERKKKKGSGLALGFPPPSVTAPL